VGGSDERQEMRSSCGFDLWLDCCLSLARDKHERKMTNINPNMAPLDQYMMERDAEVALARTAAPEDISRDATVLVMGWHGYETAVEGKNGFVSCGTSLDGPVR
jgi:hypothetical protein